MKKNVEKKEKCLYKGKKISGFTPYTRKLGKISFRSGDWWFWLRHSNPLRVAFNLSICLFSILCPFPEIKNPLLRLTGMKVGKNTFIAAGTALDIFYPELIEIGENAIIGYSCVITAHEMVNVKKKEESAERETQNSELRFGRVKIGANATIGARSIILPGVEIGAGATVGAMSLVNSSVPSGAFYAGVPAKRIK